MKPLNGSTFKKYSKSLCVAPIHRSEGKKELKLMRLIVQKVGSIKQGENKTKLNGVLREGKITTIRVLREGEITTIRILIEGKPYGDHEKINPRKPIRLSQLR